MFRQMRRFKQQLTKEQCVKILKTEKRGVLSVLGDDGYPYGVPLNFHYDELENIIYFHGAKSGHKIDAIKNCNKVCFTVYNNGVQKNDDWFYYVDSVIAFGRAELVEQTDRIYEKVRALGNKYYPSKEEVEEEIKRDISRVQLVAIKIEHMTGKSVQEK